MRIDRYCNRNVVTVTRRATVLEAANLMRHNHVGDVIIVDEFDGGRMPIGIVTDRDIVIGIVAAGLDPEVMTVSDLMLAPLVVADETADYGETVRAMCAKGVRRIPVVNAAGSLVGIVTLDDLLRQLVAPLAELAQVSARERRHEAEVRR